MASGGKRQGDIRDFIKGAKATNKATGKGGNKSNKPSNKMTPQLADELLTKISIHRGSITDLKVDCIVNAANGGLWAGAGVCGAIFRAAGYGALQKECDVITDQLGNIPTGESVLTGGYKLYAKHIIHSVGPTSQNNRALASCYVTALDLCIQRGIRSIAFPCISTGIFGFSKSAACPLALKTVRSWLINAKSYKYKDYKKMIDQKQQMKIKEAIKRNKRGYGNYDSDEGGDDDEEDEWEDGEDDKDKGKNDDNTDGGDGKDKNKEEDNTKKDNDNSNKKEVIEIHNEEDINHEAKEAEERQNDGNDDEEDDDMDVDKQEDDKKGKGGVAEEKKDENKNNDTNNDKNDDEEDNEETVFDRIDDIIFCCYDIGNWHLYQNETPEIFPSTNQNYNYLWSNKVKSRKKKAKKKEVKSDKKKENKDNKQQKPKNNDNNDNNNDDDDDINDPMDIGGDSQ